MFWGGVSPPWKYEQVGEDANEERPHANYITGVANGAAKPVAPPMMPVALSEMACSRQPNCAAVITEVSSSFIKTQFTLFTRRLKNAVGRHVIPVTALPSAIR